MEKKLNLKIVDYLKEMKNKIIQHQKNYCPERCESFIQNYPTLEITKEDLIKRKRVKNQVPTYERCMAKRANGEQCTRRCKDKETFCGTHIKGTPHGLITVNNTTDVLLKKVQVSALDIEGIVYYIDDKNNVYNSNDVFQNKRNPRIIGTCIKQDDKVTIQWK